MVVLRDTSRAVPTPALTGLPERLNRAANAAGYAMVTPPREGLDPTPQPTPFAARIATRFAAEAKALLTTLFGAHGKVA